MIYTKEDFFMSYMSMTIYNIYSFLFIIVYIVCIIIYLLIIIISNGWTEIDLILKQIWRRFI